MFKIYCILVIAAITYSIPKNDMKKSIINEAAQNNVSTIYLKKMQCKMVKNRQICHLKTEKNDPEPRTK